MSLPTPNLDDRTFQELVDEAKRHVQRRCPSWTNHNVSDPGVTLIEAFAWMTDLLLYRLNRVPDRHYVKFLELLGVSLFPPAAARAEVSFRLSSHQDVAVRIAAGTVVSTRRTATEHAVAFATTVDLEIVPGMSRVVATQLAGREPVDRTPGMGVTGAFACFAERPEPGDALYIGLDRPAPANLVLLQFVCTVGGHGIDPHHPPIVWEAWNGDGSHEVDRIGRGSLFVKAVCVSVLGGIQPGPLLSYVEGAFDDGESADGLLQRLQVLVYPDRGRFDPTDLSPDLDARDRAYKVFKGLADLDVGGFVGHAPEEAEEVPCLNFDDGAQEVFNDWRAAFEGEVVAGDHPAALESHFMKYRSLFASLALVFEAIDFVDGVEGAGVAITKINAARAYVWCEYLRLHAVRIYSPMLDTPKRRAEVLLRRIHRGDVEDGAKTRDIWRRGWSRLGTAGDLAEAIAALEDLGWVRRKEVKSSDGGRPSEILRLHPELRE